MQLVTHAIKNRMERQMCIYIWFKSVCSGKMRIENKDIQLCAKVLRVSSRTIRNNLKTLQQKKWVTHNPVTGYYYFAGFNKLMDKYGYESGTAVRFEYDKLHEIDFQKNNFKHFKAFLGGAKITHLQNIQRTKRWKLKKAERLNARPNKPSDMPVNCFLLSNFAFAQCLGVSISKAGKLKKLAKRAQLVKIKKNVCELVNLKPGHVKDAKSKSVEGTEGMYYSEKKRKFYKLMPDFVWSNMVLAQR